LSTRTKARIGAIEALYAYGSGNSEAKTNYTPYIQKQKLRAKQHDFAISLMEGVFNNLDTIDEEITKHLHSGGIDDFGLLSKAFLRLGVYEILFTNTDTSVIISQSILIGKEILDTQSIKLINGVLDNIAKTKKAKGN